MWVCCGVGIRPALNAAPAFLSAILSPVIDLAKNYAAMPTEDIERLALDAKSLTPEARVVLRLEMVRRQLPTEPLDSTDSTTESLQSEPMKQEPMLRVWAADWRHTGAGARVVLIFFAVLCVLASLLGAVLNIDAHDYANAAAFPLAIAIVGFRFVIFPFRVAWAAKRRGGSFNRWLAGSMIFGFFFAGIAYLIWKADKPILPERMKATTAE